MHVGSIDPQLDIHLACLQSFKQRSCQTHSLTPTVVQAAHCIAKILRDKCLNYQAASWLSFTKPTIPTAENLRIPELKQFLAGCLQDAELAKDARETLNRLQRVMVVAEAAVVIHSPEKETEEAFLRAVKTVEESLFTSERIVESQSCEHCREVTQSTQGLGQSLELYVDKKKPALELSRRLYFLIDLIEMIHVPANLFKEGCYAAPSYIFRLRDINRPVFRALTSCSERRKSYVALFKDMAGLDLKHTPKHFIVLPTLDASRFEVYEGGNSRPLYYAGQSWNYMKWNDEVDKTFKTFDAFVLWLEVSGYQPFRPAFPIENYPFHLEALPEFRSDLNKADNLRYIVTPFPTGHHYLYQVLFKDENGKKKKIGFHFNPHTRQCTVMKNPQSIPPLPLPVFLRRVYPDKDLKPYQGGKS